MFHVPTLAQTAARWCITCLVPARTRDYAPAIFPHPKFEGNPLQTGSEIPPPPTHGLRPGAVVISVAINLLGALLVILAMPGAVSDNRLASAWALVQFLAGVWAGVLGANSPFLHGLVAGLPALVLGLVLSSPLPAQFVVVAWALVPAAALLAAALMRFMRRRN